MKTVMKGHFSGQKDLNIFFRGIDSESVKSINLVKFLTKSFYILGKQKES